MLKRGCIFFFSLPTFSCFLLYSLYHWSLRVERFLHCYVIKALLTLRTSLFTTYNILQDSGSPHLLWQSTKNPSGESSSPRRSERCAGRQPARQAGRHIQASRPKKGKIFPLLLALTYIVSPVFISYFFFFFFLTSSLRCKFHFLFWLRRKGGDWKCM